VSNGGRIQGGAGEFRGRTCWRLAGLLISFCRAAGMDAGGDLVWIRRHGGDVGLLMGQAAAAHLASPFLFCFPFCTLLLQVLHTWKSVQQ
jgi:hypothetical protein